MFIHSFTQQILIWELLCVSTDYWFGNKHSPFPVTNHGLCLAELSEQLSFPMFFQMFQGFSLHGSFDLKWYINISRMGIRYQIPSLKTRTDILKNNFFTKNLSFYQEFLTWETTCLKGLLSVFKWNCFHKLLLKHSQAEWRALSPSLHIQNQIPTVITCFTLVKPWDLAGP